jgi:hypothetical protein
MTYDLHFYFDPVCPFAWMTSTWVRQVAALREYSVDWRFVSLRVLNAHVDYAAHFPPEYLASHTAGLRMLRVAAKARAEHGREAVGPLYAAMGAHIFEVAKADDPADRHAGKGSPERVAAILADAGLPTSLVDALDEDAWDLEITRESEEALALTGKDVGTPIIHVDPPGGPAFFGPVISRRPSDEEAVQLWEAVLTLARFPGFAEFKRSLRERPQLPALGVSAGEVGLVEDWHQGSRRKKY